MPDTDLNPNLRLLLPAGSKYNFYVNHVLLNEGLSRISSAEVTLFSADESIHMEQLNNLVGQYATLELTQSLSKEGEQCRRWFTGVITESVHCGIVHTGKDFNTIKCGLLIQTPEIALRLARHRRSFINMKPADVLNKIIEPYGFRCSTTDNIQNEISGWNDSDSFYQNGESDYTFLLRLLMKYGLSYTMIAQKPAGEAPGVCDMVFSSGSDYPLSAYEIPDAQNPIQCTCRDAESKHLSVSNWRMYSRMGTDFAAVNYEDGMKYADKSAGDSQSVRQVLFNHSPIGVMKEETAENIMKNYLRSLRQTMTRWEGDVMRLDAMPGMRLTIPDFYGEGESVDARIIAAEMSFTAPWPTILLGDSEENDAKLNIHVNCMDSNDGCNFVTPAARERIAAAAETCNAADPLWFAYSETENAGNRMLLQEASDSTLSQPVPFQAIQAVVCDADGNTSEQDTANKSFFLRNSAYEFYACYPAGDRKEIVIVTMMMPLGGFGEGLFHVPRMGDKILIACVNEARYYLMGYLPDHNRPFINSDLLNGEMDNVNEMTVLRRNRPGNDPQNYIGNNGNVAIQRYDRLEAAGTNPELQKPNHQFSEIGIYYNYTAKKK